MLNMNSLQLIGTLEKKGDLRSTHYTMIEAVISIKTLKKNNKSDRWENETKEVAVLFFNKLAEEIDQARLGSYLIVFGEVSTRFKEYNGNQYPNTTVIAKKIQILEQDSEQGGMTYEKNRKEVNHSKPVTLDEFDDDIAF